MSDNNQGWESWSNHVLLTLEKLEKKVDFLENRINKNNLDAQVEIVFIKTKAGVWGMIAGFVVSTIVSIVIGVLVYQLTIGYNKNMKTGIIQSSENEIQMVIPKQEDFLISNGLSVSDNLSILDGEEIS